MHMAFDNETEGSAPLGRRAQRVQDAVDSFAENQAKLIGLQHNGTDTEHLLAIHQKAKIWCRVNVRGTPRDLEEEGNTAGDLIEGLRGYSSYANAGRARNELLTPIFQLIVVAMELWLEQNPNHVGQHSIGQLKDQLQSRMNEKNDSNRKYYLEKIFENEDEKKILGLIDIKQVLENAKPQLDASQQLDNLEKEIDELIRKEGYPEHTKEYLMGLWYKPEPPKQKVRHMIELEEHRAAREQAEILQDELNANTEEKTFTIKQIHKINAIYEKHLGKPQLTQESLAALNKAFGGVNENIITAGEGHVARRERGYDGGARNNMGVQLVYFEHAHPDFKVKVKEQAIRSIDVKSHSKFWKGLNNMLKDVRELAKRAVQTIEHKVSNRRD